MTFADSVLHLVRAGARIDPWADRDSDDASDLLAVVPAEPIDAEPDQSDLAATDAALEMVAADADTTAEYEPGLADLEAAVSLVSMGLAKRVVLSGFTSWPGLLWRAYQLAETRDVLILPAVVRPGGKVDIVITRDTATDG